MTPQEALDLAVRLSQTWPKGLPGPSWEDAIRDLDPGVAGTAFVRLRATVTIPTGPTIADYLATYRSLDTKRPDRPANCEQCGSTGWASVIDIVDGEEIHRGVAPCRCPHGRDREDVHRRILDHNDDELRRLGLRHDEPGRMTTPPPTTPTARPAA